jgi:hypothetical protein
MNIMQPWKKILFNAEGGAGGGGGDAPAAGAAPVADAKPAADAAKAADSGDKAPAADADKKADITDAAKAASEALASAKNPSDDAAKGDDKSGEEGKDGDKADDADKSKEGEVDFDQEPAELYKELKYPEGVEVAPEVIQPFLDEFKAEKVPPALAQKIVDWHLKAQAQVEQGWVSEITSQWDAFTKDADFCKDNKLTPAAEQAYGTMRALSPEVASFFTFLNKNGGMFHPGLVQLTKLVSKGLSEGKIVKGDTPPADGGGAAAFYAKSNAKKK